MLSVFGVSSSSDGTAAGTLRWAITQANATLGVDTIQIADAVNLIELADQLGPLPVITEGLTITYLDTDLDGDRVTINGSALSGTDRHGLEIDISDQIPTTRRNATISNIRLTGFTGAGILVSDVRFVVVEACTLDANGDASSTIHAGIHVADADARIVYVTGCEIYGNHGDGISHPGSAEFTTIEGNWIGVDSTPTMYEDRANDGGAIRYSGVGSLEITGNTVSGLIRVNGPEDDSLQVLIADNNLNTDGPLPENPAEAVIFSPANGGIELVDCNGDPGELEEDRVRVLGNTIVRAGCGIWLYDCEHVTIGTYDASDRITEVYDTWEWGISVGRLPEVDPPPAETWNNFCGAITISGCHVWEGGAEGIDFANNVNGALVTGNLIEENYEEGLCFVEALDARYIEISDNVFSKNTKRLDMLGQIALWRIAPSELPQLNILIQRNEYVIERLEDQPIYFGDYHDPRTGMEPESNYGIRPPVVDEAGIELEAGVWTIPFALYQDPATFAGETFKCELYGYDAYADRYVYLKDCEVTPTLDASGEATGLVVQVPDWFVQSRMSGGFTSFTMTTTCLTGTPEQSTSEFPRGPRVVGLSVSNGGSTYHYTENTYANRPNQLFCPPFRRLGLFYSGPPCVSQITIQFRGAALVEEEDLIVRGSGGSGWTYEPTDFEVVECVEIGGWTYTQWVFEARWTFEPIYEEQLEITLHSEDVLGSGGQALDGNWLNPASFTDTSDRGHLGVFPSGDGLPGGDFVFHVTVPARADFNIDWIHYRPAPDGRVNDLDASILAMYWLVKDGDPWGPGDANGDGNVDDLDASILASTWQLDFTTWPVGERLMGGGGGSEEDRLEAIAAIDLLLARWADEPATHTSEKPPSGPRWKLFLEDLLTTLSGLS